MLESKFAKITTEVYLQNLQQKEIYKNLQQCKIYISFKLLSMTSKVNQRVKRKNVFPDKNEPNIKALKKE